MAELQKIVWVVGIAIEILLLGITLRRGIGRRFPTFLIYAYWAVFNDLGAAVYYYNHGKDYLSVYGIQVTVEGLILIAVLFDLARLAVRPLPTIISRGILGFMGFIAIGVGAAFWRLSNTWVLLPPNSRYHFFLREQLTFSFLRVLLLVLIGGLVEFLSRHYIRVGWGERELAIATGMGIYALASVAQSLGTTYQRLMAVTTYLEISLAVGIIYVVCLIYWIVCFLRPDPVNAEPRAEEAQPDSGPSTLWEKGIEGNLVGFPTQHIPKGDCA